MKGQKESVIEEVKNALFGNFTPYKDNAILMLTNGDLETIKANIATGITNSTIEYSKDRTNTNEVRTYARSMVMNHLKKAKELNGGHIFNHSSTISSAAGIVQPKTIRIKAKVAPKGVNPDLLPEDLKEFVKTLV